jgi:outer membrane protein TolC
MRCESEIFEKRPATIKNMKLFGSASALLVWLSVGIWAQTVPPTDANPAIKSAEITTTATPLPMRDRTDAARPITLREAIDSALRQASNFKAAQFNEQIAAQSIKQAKAALYPRIAANPAVIYTSPSLGNTMPGVPRPPSFLGANAITEYQGVVNAAGEIDISGRLRATLQRNKFLLESARAGSEIARRDLINAVTDAYFSLALATLRRRGAESNLQSATEFENNIKLQLDAGEVAPVDLVRARLQAANRRDELAQAQANESVNADSLRVLVGLDFTTPIAAEDLLVQMPTEGEIEGFAQAAIETRPEFAQFEAERLAAEQDIKIARGERRPQITYSVNGGFISDSLSPVRLKNSLGIQPNIGVSIPIFDWGASRSREAQARLRLQQATNNRQLAERQFAQAFFTARSQAQSAASRIRQIAASITDAELNVSASLARYRAGEASIVEVTDANNTLILQRLALYQAIFDYQTARARLLRAIGQ